MGDVRPPTLSPGDRIGRCRVVRFLASGGMGEVYLADDQTLGRDVAVKVLPPRCADEIFVERFLKEARLCSQIAHPNVITIHDVGRDGELHYIVMQYVDGEDLQTMAHRLGGRLPDLAALRLIRPIAKGLHAVHEHKRGLIHRDIKPGNIMAARDGQVYLMDFGLVREESHSHLTSSGETLGTPVYMSPEQSRCEPLDRRSDIYALGATLYQLLTGERPAKGQTHLEVILHIRSGARIPTVHELRPEIPREVSDLVQRAMAFRKEDRFPDAQQMAQRMGELLQSLPSPHRGRGDDPARPKLPTSLQIDPVPAEAVPAAAVVELVPESSATWWPHPAWLIAVALIAVAGVVASLATILPTGQQEPEPPVTEPPAVTEGMIAIEAGEVQLGNDDARIRAFLKPLISNPTLLDGKAKFVQLEPLRKVSVGAFWIDRYEVTQREYAEFLKSTNRAPPKGWDGPDPQPDKQDHPIVNIAYDDAQAYADWAGKKLPTREQWVRAFRDDRNWLFPWGDAYDATFANVGDNPKHPSTSPVEETPQDVSSFGVYNLVGNASEFIRGTVPFRGRPRRATKGADWKNPGFTSGIGSNQTLVGLTTLFPFIGFRCVVEDE